MNFSAALEAMRAGKKVRLPEMPKNYWIERGEINTFMTPYYELVLVKGNVRKWDYLKIPYRILISEDWELVLPEVKLKTSEYFICPECETKNYGFHLDDGISTCEKCGLKVRTLPRNEA